MKPLADSTRAGLAVAVLWTLVSVSSSGRTLPPRSPAGDLLPDSSFVQRQGAGLVLNGLPYRPAGANCYYLMTYAADAAFRPAVDEVLDEAAAMGLTAIRTWAFGDGAGWGALQIAPGVYDEAVFQGLVYVLDRCSRLGLRVVLPLVNNWVDYGGMDQYVAWSPTAHYHDDFYTDAACRTWYWDNVVTMTNRVNTLNGRRYRDDPAILAWELANEPRCASDPSGDKLQEWIETMSGALKSLDSNHLVAGGGEGFYADAWATAWYLDGSQGVDYLRNNGTASIDLAGSHLWPDAWGISPASAIALLRRQAADASRILGKPFVLGEFGKLRDGAASGTAPAWDRPARAHYDPATYFSPGMVPGPVPGARPLRDPSERHPRPRLGDLTPGAPPMPQAPALLPTTERDAFFASCYEAVSGRDGDGAIYWAAYDDARSDADGFGVYYPADFTTVAVIEAYAASAKMPPPGPMLLLGTPFPNPFTQSLSLPYTIPGPGVPGSLLAGAWVHAAVYDLQGRLVRDLYDGVPGTGEHVISWGGGNTHAVPVPPGVYFLRLWWAGGQWTRKAVKLR